METIIIMTECVSPAGRYTKFNVKDSGKLVATVDRIEGRYVVFCGFPFFDEVGTRTRKCSAIQLAQKKVSEFIEDAKFKLSVVREVWH